MNTPLPIPKPQGGPHKPLLACVGDISTLGHASQDAYLATHLIPERVPHVRRPRRTWVEQDRAKAGNRHRSSLQAGLLGLCSLLVLGCNSLPGKPKPGPEVPRPDAIMDFATLYRQNCRACHGERGVNGPSYPLANPVYEALVDEPTLQGIVAKGQPGTLMPGFLDPAALTSDQVNAVVKGMRAAWYKPNALAGANPPPYRAGKTADPAHGLQVYGAYCSRCHGAPDANAKSKAGPITGPAFLALISDQGLRTIVIAGRPDIGQPDWRNDLPGHPMSDQEITDVVGWLSSQRPGAAGTAPKRTGGTGR